MSTERRQPDRTLKNTQNSNDGEKVSKELKDE